MGAQRQEKDGIKYIYALGRELGFLRQMMRLETMVTDINKYLREGR